MSASDQWQRPPRPVLARAVQALAVIVRLWALPFAVVAWVVGVIVQAVVVGFGVAWESSAMRLAKRLYTGERTLQEPDESEYDDEWD